MDKKNREFKRLYPILAGVLICLFFFGCKSDRPEKKIQSVGILTGLDFFADIAVGFREKMAELGYVEDRNIVYYQRQVDADLPGEKLAAREFLAAGVDLILVSPTATSLRMKAATQGTDIPVLFANANIEGIGLVDSVRKPGGRITGVRFPGPDLTIKRFEILLELVPRAKRIWIPYLRGYPIVAVELEALRPVAADMGVTLLAVPADNVTEIEEDLDARARGGDIDLDAILIIPEPLALKSDVARTILRFASRHRIPVGGAFLVADDYGSLFGLSTNKKSVGRQSAVLAHKIFNGTPPGDIPVVTAECYLTLHHGMARTLGVTVPEYLLKMAVKIQVEMPRAEYTGEG